MRRFLLCLWLGSSALAALLLAGCSLGERTFLDRGRLSPDGSDATELAQDGRALPGGTVPSTYHMRPAIAVLGAPVPGCSCGPAPAVATVCRVEWQVTDGPAPLEFARLEHPVPRDEPAPFACPVRQCATRLGRPRPFPEALTHSALAHANDYSWLVGYLHVAPRSDTWCVRYAASEQEDVYGGALVLVSPGPMRGFHRGQLVRVEGQLVDPAPHEIKPAYSVRAIQALQER